MLLGLTLGLNAAFKHGVLMMRLEAAQHARSSLRLLLMLVKGLGGVHVHGSLKVDVWIAADGGLQNKKRTSCQVLPAQYGATWLSASGYHRPPEVSKQVREPLADADCWIRRCRGICCQEYCNTARQAP